MPRAHRTVALFVDYMVANYQMGLVKAVDRATRERGVSILVCVGRGLDAPNPGDATQTRVYELIDQNNVDGVIVASGCISNYCGPARLEQYCARFRPLPVVSIGVRLSGFPSLLISNQWGMRTAVEHLIERHGARRIAFIAAPEASSEGQDRHQGYLDALQRHGLEADEALFARGDFTVPTGQAAAEEILRRGAPFDAVVAANDYMAIGALDALRERGLCVPEDVMLVGFDDAPFARFTLPSLTTLRQPLEQLGRMAVDTVLSMGDGIATPDTIDVDVDLVARQSCRCGGVSRAMFSSLPSEGDAKRILDALSKDRSRLVQTLHSEVGVPPTALGNWAERLIVALESDLGGEGRRFLNEFAAVLAEAEPQPDLVDELTKVVGLLRSAIYGFRPPCNVAVELEQLWHEAQLAAGNAATNAQGRTRIEIQVVLDAIRSGFERIATALTLPSLKRAIVQTLPDIHIRRALVALAGNTPDLLEPFIAEGAAFFSSQPGQPYPSRHLAPDGFFPDTRHSDIMLPLSFDQDWFGLLIAEFTSHETVYGLLRDQVSSALKGGALYKATLHQAAVREQLERQHLQQESDIAAQIQINILPTEHRVEGLDISARMLSAATVGGDYYDIVPIEGGCWLGIGDVAGHGLLAGLLMLMIQGMVAAMVRQDPTAPPSRLINALNGALFDNVRHRLRRDEHASLTLVRYSSNGELVFSGAHDDPIIFRFRTRSCETLRAPGVFVGVLEDIAHLTREARATLEPGDLLVLYSDGVTESRSERNEQFGIDRLCRLIEAHADRSVDDITTTVLQEVERWQSSQIDDVTILVARHSPPGSNAGVPLGQSSNSES